MTMLLGTSGSTRHSIALFIVANVVWSLSCFQTVTALVTTTRRVALATAAGTLGTASWMGASSSAFDDLPAVTPPPNPKFRRYPQIRFIAALGDPKATRGKSGAEKWGLWRDDPGPRGVYLRNYQAQIADKNNVAPAGWTFDQNDWWLEEHGLIMSTPEPLPRRSYNKNTKQTLPFKRYVVTGDREVTTILTVFDNGAWELAKGATLYDVTHLPCRSARYTGSICLPPNANPRDFPVKPGAEMPTVSQCAKQDYAVLFVLGEEVVG